jgi:hypothetical protein
MMEHEITPKQVWPELAKEQTARSKASIERQIRRQIRLMLQLKANRSQRALRPETNADAAAPLAGPASSPFFGGSSDPSFAASAGAYAEAIATNVRANGPKGEERVVNLGVVSEKRENWSNKANQVFYRQQLNPRNKAKSKPKQSQEVF